VAKSKRVAQDDAVKPIAITDNLKSWNGKIAKSTIKKSFELFWKLAQGLRIIRSSG
jgi:hypothetical protein